MDLTNQPPEEMEKEVEEKDAASPTSTSNAPTQFTQSNPSAGPSPGQESFVEHVEYARDSVVDIPLLHTGSRSWRHVQCGLPDCFAFCCLC